jgi:hypothetical protein
MQQLILHREEVGVCGVAYPDAAKRAWARDMPQFTWLDDTSFAQTILLEGLSIRMKDLFDRICALDCGWPLLLFLDENPNVLMTDDDLAFLIDELAATVQSNLYAMIDFGLIRQMEVAGITLFGMTKNPEARQIIRELCAWQNQWRTRLAHIDRLISGRRKRVSIREET